MVVNIEPVADKWRAFGWDTIEIDGNDMVQASRPNWGRGRRKKPRYRDAKPGRAWRVSKRVRRHTLSTSDLHGKRRRSWRKKMPKQDRTLGMGKMKPSSIGGT
jgi:hypothetical protein